nr:MAG TPA_asm: bacteriocin [Caudoviricetes sp.]
MLVVNVSRFDWRAATGTVVGAMCGGMLGALTGALLGSAAGAALAQMRITIYPVAGSDNLVLALA